MASDSEAIVGGAISATEDDGHRDLSPVEPGYKNVLRVRLAVFWLVICVARRNARPTGAQRDRRLWLSHLCASGVAQ